MANKSSVNSLSDALATGNILAGVAAANAEFACHEFSDRTRKLIVQYLRENGESSGEDITDFCKQQGVVPHDDRAFGGVFLFLSRTGVIHATGFCLRRKGHGTSGGRRWSLVS